MLLLSAYSVLEHNSTKVLDWDLNAILVFKNVIIVHLRWIVSREEWMWLTRAWLRFCLSSVSLLLDLEIRLRVTDCTLLGTSGARLRPVRSRILLRSVRSHCTLSMSAVSRSHRSQLHANHS